MPDLTKKTVLELPILKLSKTWSAIAIATVRKAMEKLFSDKVKVLDPETYQLYAFNEWIKQSIGENDLYIQTSSCKIKVPKFIVCNEYMGDSGQKQKVVYSRRNIFIRDAGCCQYCLKKVKGDDWEVEHVLPKSRGGKTNFENCVVCCTVCNRKKANRTPSEAKMSLKKKVRIGNETVVKTYKKPKIPHWSILYRLKKTTISSDWKPFLKNIISDIYWDVELENEP